MFPSDPLVSLRVSRIKNKSIVQGDSKEALFEWLGSLNPLLLGKCSHFSEESLVKLESLRTVNQQADREIAQVCKSFRKMESEYEALCKKKRCHLLLFGLEYDGLDHNISKNIKAISDLIINNVVGDGTHVGALIELSDVIVEGSKRMRQNMILKDHIKNLKQKNAMLMKSVEFNEDQLKVFTSEAQNLDLCVKDAAIQNSIFHAEAKKFNESRIMIKTELEKLGIDSSLSHRSILDDHKRLIEMLAQIKQLKGRLEKEFADLPPSIPEALEQIENTKKELYVASETFKKRLMTMKRNHF